MLLSSEWLQAVRILTAPWHHHLPYQPVYSHLLQPSVTPQSSAQLDNPFQSKRLSNLLLALSSPRCSAKQIDLVGSTTSPDQPPCLHATRAYYCLTAQCCGIVPNLEYVCELKKCVLAFQCRSGLLDSDLCCQSHFEICAITLSNTSRCLLIPSTPGAVKCVEKSRASLARFP